MAPDTVVEQATGSSGGVVVPLILIALIAALASSNGSDGTATVDF